MTRYQKSPIIMRSAGFGSAQPKILDIIFLVSIGLIGFTNLFPKTPMLHRTGNRRRPNQPINFQVETACAEDVTFAPLTGGKQKVSQPLICPNKPFIYLHLPQKKSTWICLFKVNFLYLRWDLSQFLTTIGNIFLEHFFKHPTRKSKQEEHFFQHLKSAAAFWV